MGAKGYDGLIVSRSGDAPPNTVVVGVGGRKPETQQQAVQITADKGASGESMDGVQALAHNASAKLGTEVTSEDILDAIDKVSAVQQTILIPTEDHAQRLKYLFTVRDYLRTQLAVVEAQLDAES